MLLCAGWLGPQWVALPGDEGNLGDGAKLKEVGHFRELAFEGDCGTLAPSSSSLHFLSRVRWAASPTMHFHYEVLPHHRLRNNQSKLPVSLVWVSAEQKTSLNIGHIFISLPPVLWCHEGFIFWSFQTVYVTFCLNFITFFIFSVFL